MVCAGYDVAGASRHGTHVRDRLRLLCLLRMLRQRVVRLLGLQLRMLHRGGLPRPPVGDQGGLRLSLLQQV